MGAFIAALRKANGLTQRELAEKLNVSDKAVSRWERDECAPDLSLIPIIAEIFNVSADELLSGERRRSDDISDSPSKPSARSEKQTKHLLSSAVTKLKNLSMISFGISAAAALAAVLLAYFVKNNYITFIVTAFLLLISTACEITFLNNSLSSVTNEEIENAKIDDFKIKAIGFSKILFAVNFYILYAFAALLIYLPFCTGKTGDIAYLLSEMDFSIGENAFVAVLFAVFGYILFRTVWAYVTGRLIKSGVYPTDGKGQGLNRFKKRFFTTSTAVILFTVLICCYLCASDVFILGGTVFDDFESYKAYVAIESSDEEVTVQGLALSVVTFASTASDSDSDSDSDDDSLFYGEAVDENDNIVETYPVRKSNIYCEYGGYGNLPITVYTVQDVAYNIVAYRSICAIAVLAEYILIAVLYRVISRRLQKNSA